MKRFQIFIMVIAVATFVACGKVSLSQEPRSIYLIGASIAYPENTWFEMACESIDVTPINRALSATRPTDSAVKMFNNAEYTLAELDDFDVFAIMHCHEMEVCDESKLLDDYNDYVVEPNMDYSQAFDYIICKYIDDCRALAFNPNSKWYGVSGGKPIKIILCTYWHDARVVYNAAIRRLTDKWSDYAILCAFDENIGFTKESPDPQTGEQVSVRYAQNGINDTEVLYGVVYGWHPTRGRDAEIQQRMAAIFASTALRFIQ